MSVSAPAVSSLCLHYLTPLPLSVCCFVRGCRHLFNQLGGDLGWAHSVSDDMVHWYHLAVAIGKGPGNSTWEDGSACDGTVSFPDLGREPFNGSAPVIMYGPACGKPVATAADADSRLGARSGAGVGDAPRVEVALPQDATDPYLTTWVKTQPGPVVFDGTPCSFPGRVWKSKVGPYWNMLCSLNGTGCWARYTSSDPRLMRRKLADKSFLKNGTASYCDAGAMFHRLPGAPPSGGAETSSFLRCGLILKS